MPYAIPMVLNNKEEIFTHKDDDGKLRHFPAGFMTNLACKLAGSCTDIMYVTLKISIFPIQSIKENRGIEEPRLKRLKSPWLDMPITGVFWEDESLIVIDGHHRIVKMAEMGMDTIRAYIFKYGAWQQFLLPLPDDPDFYNRNSGIIENEQKRALGV